MMAEPVAKVLIINDLTTQRENLYRCIEKICAPFAPHSPEELENYLIELENDDRAYTVVILDIILENWNMPEDLPDGKAIVKRLRPSPQTLRPFIIILTNYRNREIMQLRKQYHNVEVADYNPTGCDLLRDELILLFQRDRR